MVDTISVKRPFTDFHDNGRREHACLIGYVAADHLGSADFGDDRTKTGHHCRQER